GVKVGIDDDVDVIRLQSDTGKAWEQHFLCAHHRLHDLGERAPAFRGVVDHGRMTPGIEQHVTLLVPYQRRADRQVKELAAVRAGNMDALLHPEAACGQEVESHDVFPWRSAAAARIAATIFW